MVRLPFVTGVVSCRTSEKLEERVRQKVQRKKMQLEAATVSEHGEETPPVLHRLHSGPLQETEKLIETLANITDKFLLAFPGLLNGNSGQEDLESFLKVCLATCPQSKDLLTEIGFDTTEKRFIEIPTWAQIPSVLSQWRKNLQDIANDLAQLPEKGRVGRPYGKTGMKRTPSRSPPSEAAASEPCPSSTKSAETSLRGQKRRKANKEVDITDQGDDVQGGGVQGGGVRKKLFEEYDPEASDLEETHNKSASISLKTKALIVEFGKRLESERCPNVEKEVMVRYKKYFWSEDMQRFKSGMLRKWTKTHDCRIDSLSLVNFRKFHHLLSLFFFLMGLLFDRSSICCLCLSFLQIRTYEREMHYMIPWKLLSSEETQKMKQLPDWLRKAIGLEKRHDQGHSKRVAFEIEASLNEVLERMIGGSARNLQTAAPIKTATILQAVHKLQDMWKTSYLKICEEMEMKPEAFLDKHVDGKWLQRFLVRWQWTWLASNTKGAFLADDSQEMKEARRSHRAQRAAHDVPWELTLNYDQLWRSAYEPPDRILHKGSMKRKQGGPEEFGEHLL